MKISAICPDSFGANTYMLTSDGKAFVVDPAVSVSAVRRALDAEGARLCGILLTHAHFDHTVSVDTLREQFDVPLMVHSADAPMLVDGAINGFFHFYGQECVHSPADVLLSDGEILTLGEEQLEVIHTPGHSPGSVCFLTHDEVGVALLTGDTLFATSIGRCDLWCGDDNALANSLVRLSQYPQDARIYPGHMSCALLGDALTAARYYIDF